MGKAATRKRKADKLATQAAEAIAFQDDLDEQFARDEDRGEASGPAGPSSTPTPAPRVKRARKKVVVFEKGTNPL